MPKLATTPDENSRLRTRYDRLAVQPERVKKVPRTLLDACKKGDSIIKCMWVDMGQDDTEAPGGPIDASSTTYQRRCVTDRLAEDNDEALLQRQRVEDVARVKAMAEEKGWDWTVTCDYYGLDLQIKLSRGDADCLQHQRVNGPNIRRGGPSGQTISKYDHDVQSRKRQRKSSLESNGRSSLSPSISHPRLVRPARDNLIAQAAAGTGTGTHHAGLSRQKTACAVKRKEPIQEGVTLSRPPKTKSSEPMKPKVEEADSEEEIVILDRPPASSQHQVDPSRRGSVRVKVEASASSAAMSGGGTIWAWTNVEEAANAVARTRCGTDTVQAAATQLLGLYVGRSLNVGALQIGLGAATDHNTTMVGIALNILMNPNAKKAAKDSSSDLLTKCFGARIETLEAGSS